MHIILGALSAILTLLYILERLDIDIGWYNPWSWRSRRAWARRYTGDPVYSVENPVHAAAILITGVARLDGSVCAEEKQALIGLFEEKFSLGGKAAAELLGSAAHLLGAPQVVETQLDGLASKTKGLFSAEQSDSIIDMMERVAALDGGPTPLQLDYVNRIRRVLQESQTEGAWASP
jgi:uncharacterized tellurite resistance protein B-like protein